MTDAGERFAYRERAHTPGDPVRPVALVKEGPPRSQKVKVRWLDGEYEGLEEWVPKVRLVSPWGEVEALLDDERRMFAALEASGDVYGTTIYKAVETVFFAIPQEAEAEVLFGMKAIERELLSIDDLDVAAARLGLDAGEALLRDVLSESATPPASRGRGATAGARLREPRRVSLVVDRQRSLPRAGRGQAGGVGPDLRPR